MSKKASAFQVKFMAIKYRGKEVFKPLNTSMIDEHVKCLREYIANIFFYTKNGTTIMIDAGYNYARLKEKMRWLDIDPKSIMTLPMGYDTPVGELGETLSGGERQRLGIARAFLHDAPFILLDEPTSNLDSLNEAVILQSLNDSRKDKTIVLVSHRASTMCIADEVYSVENGRMS